MIYRLSDDYHVRGLRESDLDGPYPSWFDDQEVCRFNSHGKFARTEAWFRDYLRSLDAGHAIVWAICHERDGHIGNISLQELSLINRTAELAILLGDRRHWGRGVGKLAGAKLVEHGFRKVNLNRIYCGMAASNEGMKALAVALGMKQEGVRRSHLFLEGEWVDVVDYGILASEYGGPQTA
jgi:[ribosomal protein S5]-alanine N-acetyltransferase